MTTVDSALWAILETLPEGASRIEIARAVLGHVVVWTQGDDLAWASSDLLLRDPRFTVEEVASEVEGSSVGVSTANVLRDSGGMWVQGVGEQARKITLAEREALRDARRPPARDICTYCGTDQGVPEVEGGLGPLRQGWDCHRGCGN